MLDVVMKINKEKSLHRIIKKVQIPGNQLVYNVNVNVNVQIFF